MLHEALPPHVEGTPAERRDGYESMLAQLPIPDAVEITAFERDGVTGWWVDSIPGPPDRVGVMLHGGGYWIGSAAGYRAYAAYVSYVTRSRVLVPEYRLAPEHPYPAAIEDSLVAIAEAVREVGAESTFVIGDSAGGGLTLGCMLARQDRGEPRVAANVLVSPWIDLSAAGGSMGSRAETDQPLPRNGFEQAARYYLGDRAPSEAPWAFPLRADLSGLPPVAILVGTTEALVHDSEALAAKLAAEGVEFDYRAYPEMVHVWPLFSSFLPEGREALLQIAEFVDAHVRGSRREVSASRFERWITSSALRATGSR